MESLLLVVLNVVGSVAGVGLFYYFLHRAVLSARKKGRAGIGGQLMATALTLSSGTSLDPAREVASESQKLKRNQDGRGDPESRFSTVAPRALRWCPGEDLNLHECYPTGT